MKFSIAYAAKWGHALHVELTFAAADGYQDTMDLPMTTRDGYRWEVEMASRQNRHHPFVAVAYCYCVKDAEGKVLRRESFASARQYVLMRARISISRTIGWRRITLMWKRCLRIAAAGKVY